MNQVKQKALICTGFHRSATSTTANYLHDAGLDLGDNLVPGHISNAKGHFEDWDMVKLHDQQLRLSGTDLQFHGQCKLLHDPMPFKCYAQERFAHAKHWGGKDPRASLFLDDWHDALGESGNYLFIVRHWSCCIESLLHRHSRELAHHLPEPSIENEGLKLWINPQLAAQMWLTYNKRLLEFAKQYKDKVLLVSQRALFEGAPILSALNSRFDFNLNSQVSTPFKAELLRDQASSNILDSLSSSLKVQLNLVWEELLTLADFKSDNEEPKYVKSPVIRSELFSSFLEELNNINKHHITHKITPNVNNDCCLNDLLFIENNAQQIIEYLNVGHNLNNDNVSRFLSFFEGAYALDGAVLFALAKFLARVSRFELAITYFEKSITLGTYYPCMDMMLGQCYQAILKYHKALFFYNKAIKNNPTNPLFYTNKAICLVFLNKHHEAENIFKNAIEIDKENISCILPYFDFLIKGKREEEAKLLLLHLNTKIDSQVVKNLLIQLELKSDYKVGEEKYLQNIKSKLFNKNKVVWLASTCSYITNSNAELDFLGRVDRHWQDVLE